MFRNVVIKVLDFHAKLLDPSKIFIFTDNVVSLILVSSRLWKTKQRNKQQQRQQTLSV